MRAIEIFFTITRDLIKRLADGDAAFFKLNLYQRQAIDQNGDIIAIGMAAYLLKLFDDLALIVGNVFVLLNIYFVFVHYQTQNRAHNHHEFCGFFR